MTIAAGDIQFFKSVNMTDAPEGGGGPSGNVIVDGDSNAMFPDLSELDRALGRSSVRQVHLSVQTPNTEVYLGANVIIAEPPDDPNVSVVMVQYDDLFATRDAIKSRVESFLAPGPLFAGYLFGNMLEGQNTLTLLQRVGLTPPNVGDNLVLTKDSGTPSEVIQFVRITSVASLLRSFDDSSGSYERVVVSLGLSDTLRADFSGFDATRIDPSFDELTAHTLVQEAVVANAARYYGCVPLALDAAMGSFTLKAETIYTRIVPSAQVETPIADARTNGLAGALVAAGEPITETVSLAWSPAQSLFVGGGVLPGTFTAENSGFIVTDDGGALMLAGEQIGTIDYEAGVAQLSVDVLPGGGITYTYTPAVAPLTVPRSLGIPITINTRSLSYVMTLGSVPARKTLQVSYAANGRWYTLRDDGAGRLRGIDSSFGVGTLNRTTGTISVTLGALPDTGSALILQWSETGPVVAKTNTSLQHDGRWYAPLNTNGTLSEVGGAGSITPGTLTLTWNHGGAKTAHDDDGLLVGDAEGFVDYQAGLIYFMPPALLPDNTVVSIAQTRIASTVGTLTWVGSGPFTTALPAGITPKSIFFEVAGTLTVSATGGGIGTVDSPIHVTPLVLALSKYVIDDGLGNLKCLGDTCGTINYSTGAMALDPSLIGFTNPVHTPGAEPAYFTVEPAPAQPGGVIGLTYNAWLDAVPAGRTVTRTASALAPRAQVSYSTTAAVSSPASVTVSSYFARLDYLVPNYTLTGVGFRFNGQRYVASSTGMLGTDIDAATGIATPVGSVNALAGVLQLDTWPTGATNGITEWTGVQAPPVSGAGDRSTNLSTVFRIAAAPVRPGSFSILGTMTDGTVINATAATNGKINHARVKGRINYENGVVELVFTNAAPTSLGTLDVAYMEIPGVTTVNLDNVQTSTLRYNAVSYAYIPLDASIIGLDPVRLPSDGRVPVIRPGYTVVVGNTGKMSAATVSNGQTLDTGRVRLSRLAVRGANGVLINAGFTTDLEAGTVSFTNVTGYSQPVTVEHRIEDMALVADAQINGDIRLTRPLTHDYDADGTYVSSALLLGDVYARVSLLFDQFTWSGAWSDILDGDAATGTYNAGAHPIVLTNDGAITERWALRFTSTTAFEIIGEHVGVIGTSSINVVTAPINSNTGTPFFEIPEEGWGAGWAPGNILRMNTVGAIKPIPLVRTVQQGPEAGTEYSFTLLARGDVDRP